MMYSEVTEAVLAGRLTELRLNELRLILDARADPIAVFHRDGSVVLAGPAGPFGVNSEAVHVSQAR